MSDLANNLFNKVTSDMDLFKKILSKVPGFSGYMERQSRRDADKLLRDTLASRFEEQWQRISSIQRDLINQGEIASIDDLEAAAIKYRTFIDKIRRAPRGYSGLFDAVKINEKELAQLYQYDSTMLDLVDETSRAIDNVEASIGSDGLPAAIRNLEGVARNCLEVYGRRAEVVNGANAS